MLRRTSQFQYQIQQLVDAVVAMAAFTLAVAVRRQFYRWFPQVFPMFDALWSHAWLYILLVPLWLFLFDLFGLYQRREGKSPLAAFSVVVRSNLMGIVIVFFLLYLLKIKHIPRVLILLFSAWDVLLMMGKEALVQRFLPSWQPVMNILLVGTPRSVAEMHARLRLPAQSGVHPVCWMGTTSGMGSGSADRPDDLPELGQAQNLEKVLHAHTVDVVVLCSGNEPFADIQRIIEQCETEGVEVWLAADFFRTRIARPQVDEFQDMPVLVFRTAPPLSWALVMKRLMDVAGAAFLIILTGPLMLVIAILIKLTSPGPVLFMQKRCTLHGRIFNMYKFRTMVTEAEQLKQELSERNEMQGPVFKIRNDPRVTPIGRFLRRHSLDELPQLFNVLIGDMSLVGPRPPIPSEVDKYENWQRRRLSMRAGITCLWQISGRNEVGFDEWMRLDLEYIDNWSLALDIAILLKTPLAMIRGTGY